MHKHGLSERDICTKFITPALRKAGWDEMLQIREEVGFTKGRIIVRGKMVLRGRAIVAERVEYLDENDRLVTESLRDFTRTALKRRFASLDDFLKRWKSAERKQLIIKDLEDELLALDVIADELGKNLDPFDLICHVAFDRKPLPRRERSDNVKKRGVFSKYGGQARAVLDALLAKYADEGVLNLDGANVLKITPFSAMGGVVQTITAFGGKEGFEQAVHELQAALYQEAG
jgi:type I restriction enzyme R subunit